MARCVLALVLLVSAGACQGKPQAVARFLDYPADTYPQTSFHTAQVCKVIAVRVDYTPALAPGTRAKIHVATFGGAKAELGQIVPPATEIEQDAAADGSLGFGFHFLEGVPGRGSADIVIEIPGRPVQRITVWIIR